MPDNASADAFSDPKSAKNGLVFVVFCNRKGVSKMLMVLSDAIKMGLTGGNYGFFEANKHVKMHHSSADTVVLTVATQIRACCAVYGNKSANFIVVHFDVVDVVVVDGVWTSRKFVSQIFGRIRNRPKCLADSLDQCEGIRKIILF